MFHSGVLSKFRSFLSRKQRSPDGASGAVGASAGGAGDFLDGSVPGTDGPPGLTRVLTPSVTYGQWRCQEAVPDAMDDMRTVLSPDKDMQRPTPRSGHVAVMAGDTYMYLYGGYEKPNLLFPELWRFHIMSETWERVEMRGQIPEMTCSQSAVTIGANRILVFGGTGVPFGELNSNRLTEFNVSEGVWRELGPMNVDADETPIPSPRFGQAMVTDGFSVWVVGGTDGHVFYADVWRFDLEAGAWEQCHSGQGDPLDDDNFAPEGRYRHEAVLRGTDILIIGGGWPNVPGGTVLNDIIAFSTVTNTWRRIPCQGAAEGYPQSRRSHTCSLVGGQIVMLGGANVNAGEVWVLEPEEWQWRHVGSEWPVPSYFHTTVATRDGRLYTFGGVNAVVEVAGVNERHNRVCCFNALQGVPSLQELALQSTATYFGRMGPLLAEIGVPRHLITRFWT
eukprot:m.191912 g.191912  ORF g.191912 m.191912 type:complete len:449 (-) comp18490_c0_seq1:106-1452(-)